MSPLERAGATRASPAGCVLAALLLLGSALGSPSHADPAPFEFRHGVSILHELKYPPDFPHFAFVNPDAPKGGTLVMPSLTDFNTLSPLVTFERAPGSNWVHETLLLRAGDEPVAYYGSLAEQIALGADRRSIAFRLHPGARWHDGVPITSNDVKFTFDAIKADVTSSTIRMASPWFESVDIVNDREFVIRMIADPSLSLTPLARYIPIMPAHYWADKDPTKTTLTPPLGSGPYRIAAVEKGRFVRYERVPDYWGRDIPVNRGRFNFDTILYDVYRDATVAREALRKGLLDVWLQWGHDTLAFDTPARDKGWLVQGKRRSRMTIGARFWLILNNRRHPFDDARVREALSLAFDFEWQNRALFAGRLTRADSYFQNSVFAATGLPSESELKLLEPFRHLIPERVFTETFRFPRTSGVGRNRSGLMQAQALLAEAGWQLRDGVLIGEGGEPLKIEFLSRVPGGATQVDAVRRRPDGARYRESNQDGRGRPVLQSAEKPRLRRIHQDRRLRVAALGTASSFSFPSGRCAAFVQPWGNQSSSDRRPGRCGEGGTVAGDDGRGVPGPRPRVALELLSDSVGCGGRPAPCLLGQVRPAAAGGRSDVFVAVSGRLVVRPRQGRSHRDCKLSCACA